MCTLPHKLWHVQNLVNAQFIHQNHLVNWSNTHECHPKRYYEPETVEELEHIVAEAHEKGLALAHHSRHALSSIPSNIYWPRLQLSNCCILHFKCHPTRYLNQ